MDNEEAEKKPPSEESEPDDDDKAKTDTEPATKGSSDKDMCNT
jgi:hypothetical protein